MKDKTLMVIAVAVVLSVTAIVVASNMNLKILSTSDFVLISPEDGSTFTGSPTFSFTVNKQTTNPVTELRVMSSGSAWTMEWSRTGDFTYTFSSLPDGNYTWYVILWSLSGSTYTRVGVSETRTFTISGYVPPPPQPKPPVAKISFPDSGETGESICMGIDGSYDPDGQLVGYIFDFGDGYRVATKAGIACHTYEYAGNYTGTLTVKDNDGLTDTASKQIIITGEPKPPSPPVAVLKVPSYAEVGSEITLDGCSSYDINNNIVSYEFDCGDGCILRPQCIQHHTYNKPGTYTVTLTVTDSTAKSDTTSKTIVVKNPISYYTLTINSVGNGYITSSPPPSSDGKYENGTVVTITAHAYEGWTFDHWGGDVSSSFIRTAANNPITITMDSDKSVTAYFVEIQPDQFTLTLTSDPPEGGTITATPSGGTYDAGTPVTLTAIPNNGYAFKGWTGTGITDKSSLTTTVTINSDMTVTAHFEKTTTHMWWLPFLIAIGLVAIAGGVYYKNKKW